MNAIKVIFGKIFTEEFKNRIKSYLWRGAMFLIAVAVKVIAQNLNLFNMDATYTVLLGLFLGEISKYLNNKYDFEGKMISFVKTGDEVSQ